MRSGRSKSSHLWQKGGEKRSRIGGWRPLMFDFGIADLVLLGPGEHEVHLVEFRCRCAVVVARGQVIRRTRGFRLVCEHVSADG
jgi:hypothetical protein